MRDGEAPQFLPDKVEYPAVMGSGSNETGVSGTEPPESSSTAGEVKEAAGPTVLPYDSAGADGVVATT